MGKRKWLFVGSRLGGGGAEMHLVRILNELIKYIEIDLVLTRGNGGYESLLSKEIKKSYLTKNINSSLFSLFYSFYPLKSYFKRHYQVVISIMDLPNILVLLAAPKKIKKVIICQVSPMKQYKSNGVLGKYILKLMKRYYPHSDLIISLSEGVKKELVNDFGIDENNIVVIPNAGFSPNDLNSFDRNIEKTSDDDVFKFIACGRLTKQKGFDLLLEAYAKLQNKKTTLTILGEGEDRAELEALAAKLNISDKVFFYGFVKAPSFYFNSSDAFVLSSRWEGFGNVIIEAMLCELPVISFDCPHGPSEIIESGKNGILVPTEDIMSLSAEMDTLLNDSQLCKYIAKEGYQRALEFSSAKIAELYKENIIKCVE